MASDEVKGFAVNHKTTSFVLSLFAIGAVTWNTISYAKDQEYRLQNNESRIERMETELQHVVATNTELTKQVAELIFVIKGSSLIQNSK